MTVVALQDSSIALRADPSRVRNRLFIPGESSPGSPSRTRDIADRVLALPAGELATAAAAILDDFGAQDDDLPELFRAHARMVLSDSERALTADETVVLGAAFTAQYSVEAAAICNPSAVPHPDQTGLAAGELRIVLALRSIGEGHISSISFLSAVLGPDGGCVVEEREKPLSHPLVRDGRWRREHLHRALEVGGRLTETEMDVLRVLPSSFDGSEVEAAIAGLPRELLMRHDTREQLERIRRMVSSAYRVSFDPAEHLSRRVLLPSAEEESNGMEDARFVLFTDEDGRSDYRASYTAYDGRSIAPRLLVTTDFAEFSMHRLTGDAAHNKGMALFPRPIGGRRWALTRSDGERISLAHSRDGMSWTNDRVLSTPQELWEVVQLGNCGSPIETPSGWLVLTHGVGLLRSYSLGAILLDLEDPRRVIGRLTAPLLSPSPGTRDGYVPNVVYSCGGIVHDGTLWIPYGLNDDHIRVASAPLDAVLGAMAAA